MTTVANADHGTLFNFDHVNTRLADIDAIGYSTYREPTSTGFPHILPSINIAIDKNGPPFASGDFATLVFEPIYNADQGAVVPGVWQTWNGIAGNWWSTRDFPPAVVSGVTYPWSYFVATFPDATILGGFGVNQGSFSANLVAGTDALTLGVGGTTWIYNFEPSRSGDGDDGCKGDAKDDERRGDGSSSRRHDKCKTHGHDGSDEN